MKPTLILQSTRPMTERSRNILQEQAEGLGYKCLVVEEMEGVQLHEPAISFREQAALAIYCANISKANDAEYSAGQAIRDADHMIGLLGIRSA